jgi:hypothetical protein
VCRYLLRGFGLFKPFALYDALVQDLHDSGIPVIDRPIRECKTALEAASTQILSSLFKKYEEIEQKDRATLDSRAISKFLLINNQCRTWSRDRRETLYLDCLIGYFKDEVHRFFNPANRVPLVSTWEEILVSARCGPGASVGSRGNDFYTKMFSSKLACTSRVLEFSYLNYFKLSDLWSEAEKYRNDQGFGFEVVPGNRLTTVPKNADISRVIAIEPGLNMFFQLGLAEILTRRLKRVFNIDLSSQQNVNRELAKRGSLDDDLCTIDLESASDSMSWNMIKEYFPSDIVGMLALMRSPRCTLPDGRQETLHMISTMGNGFTFPLQTIVFCCVVSACLRYLGPVGQRFRRSGEDWTVFGDDIVVSNKIVGPVIDLLEHLGFTVNKQKSFSEGPFRESCGVDYFRGRNVRGVYIRRLSTLQDRCAAINQLNYWSARTGIPLVRTVGLLLKATPLQEVPPWDNDDAGVKVPYSLVTKKRMHKAYQSIMYRRYVSKPHVMVFGEGLVNTPKGHKRRIFNPSGVFLSMLNGTLVSGRINVRHDVKLYRSRQAIAPNWDLSPTGSGLAPDIEWQRWETAVTLNLGRKA